MTFGEASYQAARQVFNGAVNRRPKLFAFCDSARDVQEAVRAARASAARSRRGSRLGRKGAEPPGAGSGSLGCGKSRWMFEAELPQSRAAHWPVTLSLPQAHVRLLQSK